MGGIDNNPSPLRPRPYQLQLSQVAQKQNVIDTGAGKTLVSILLIVDAFLKYKKLAIFLVPTVPLVVQQAQKIREFTIGVDERAEGLHVGEYTRDDVQSVTFWDAQGWRREVSRQDVLVFTPQLFLNVLRHGFIQLKDVGLMIFDECHHASKNHPYRIIMQEFYHPLTQISSSMSPTLTDHDLCVKTSTCLPRIFGMTASPIYQKVKTQQEAQDKLKELESILHCKVVTIVERAVLEGFVPKALERIVEYEKEGNAETLDSVVGHYALFYQEQLQRISSIAALENKLDDIANNIKESMDTIQLLKQELGLLCAGLVAEKMFQQYDRKVRGSGQLSTPLDKPSKPAYQDVGYLHLTPKVHTLLRLLHERASRISTENPLFRCLIFADRRQICIHLSYLLNYIAPHLFPSLKAGYVIGRHSRNATTNAGISSKDHKAAFEKFKSGELNILVVTRVAEEGLDVPTCNLVISFDLFRSNTGYVQSRGRARHMMGSEYIVMVPRGDALGLKTWVRAQMAEKMTRSVAIQKSGEKELEMDHSSEDDDLARFLLGEEDVSGMDSSASFKTLIGAKATLGGAVSILQRYLNRWKDVLPSHLLDSPQPPVTVLKASGGSVLDVILVENGQADPDVWNAYQNVLMKQNDIMASLSKTSEHVKMGPILDWVDAFKLGFVYCLLVPVHLDEAHFFTPNLELVPRCVRRRLDLLVSKSYSHQMAFIPIFGFLKLNKKLAMASAALESVRFLFHVGALNENLLPRVTYLYKTGSALLSMRAPKFKSMWGSSIDPVYRFLLTQRNVAAEAEGSFIVSPSRIPALFVKNQVWTGISDTTRSSCLLYFTVIQPQFPQSNNHQSFAILTHAPFPCQDVPDCTVHFGPQRTIPVHFRFLAWDPQSACGVGFDEAFYSQYHQDESIGDESDEEVGSNLKRMHHFPDKPIQKPSRQFVAVKLEKKQLRKIIMFQNKMIPQLFNMAAVDATGDFCISPKGQLSKELSYLVVPMIAEPSSEKPCWKMDRAFINDVVDDKNVPLWHWMGSIQRLNSKKGSPSRKKPRSNHSNLHATLFHQTLGNPVNVDMTHFKQDIFRMNQILSNTLVLTPHNQFVYEILELDETKTAKSTFVHRTESKTITFEEYFGRWYPSIPHPDFYLVKAKLLKRPDRYPSHPSRLPTAAQDETDGNDIIYLIPDCCHVLPMSREYLQKMQLLPTVLDKMSQYALADQVKSDLTDHPLVRHSTILTALTAPSAFESTNYERLELLGDSFLKFITSWDVFNQHPHQPEGVLTKLRANVISNRSLRTISSQKAFDTFAITEIPMTKAWSPSWVTGILFKRAEYVKSQLKDRQIGQKLAADIVESLLGAVYADAGHEAALACICRLGLVQTFQPKSSFEQDIHRQDSRHISYPQERSFDLSSFKLPVEHVRLDFDKSASKLEEFQGVLGYTFRDPKLLQEAFSHASCKASSEISNSYERLEFLGDAALDWMVTRFLYHSYPNASPGLLSELRQVAVCNETLARISLMLRLNELVLYRTEELTPLIQCYLQSLVVLDSQMNENAVSLAIDAPKVLGDIFESLVGAVFVDCDYDPIQVWNVFRPILVPYLNEHVNPSVVSKGYVRLFVETIQKRGFLSKDICFKYQPMDMADNKDIEQGASSSCFKCTISLCDKMDISVGYGNTHSGAKRLACASGLEWIKTHDQELKELLKSVEPPQST